MKWGTSRACMPWKWQVYVYWAGKGRPFPFTKWRKARQMGHVLVLLWLWNVRNEVARGSNGFFLTACFLWMSDCREETKEVLLKSSTGRHLWICLLSWKGISLTYRNALVLPVWLQPLRRISLLWWLREMSLTVWRWPWMCALTWICYLWLPFPLGMWHHPYNRGTMWQATVTSALRTLPGLPPTLGINTHTPSPWRHSISRGHCPFITNPLIH